MAYYKVTITYPTGKFEEIEEMFNTLQQAKDYADFLLVQVGQNSRYKSSFDDGPRLIKPYYIIKEKEGKESEIVYDSRE